MQTPAEQTDLAADGGDRTEQFLLLYNREQRRLYALIRAMLLNRSDAEDVFQDTCLALWKSFGEFTPGTNFAAWAGQVARHRVLAFCKKRGRGGEAFDDELLSLLVQDWQSGGDLLVARQRALEGCLDKLRVADRDLLQRRYHGGLSTVELAAAVGRPLNTLYKALRRIRRSLRACIEQTLGAEGGRS